MRLLELVGARQRGDHGVRHPHGGVREKVEDGCGDAENDSESDISAEVEEAHGYSDSKYEV